VVQRYGDRYEVTRHLGTGGMASVFLAFDPRLERFVAIKVLHPDYASDETSVKRFRREVVAAARINDPRIVGVFDSGSENGTYYIVMEYVQGRTLREVLDHEAPLPAHRATELTAEVCQALQVAHSEGIVHRDVKPSNIFVTTPTKIGDFGIARAVSEKDQTVTQTGTVIGTAAYLAPEQAQGLPVDLRSDLYSLTVLLYEMLTGEVPFKGDTPVTVAYKHVNEEPKPPSLANSILSKEIDAFVMKGLAKNPDDRWQTADEMERALQNLLRRDRRIVRAPDAKTVQMETVVDPTLMLGKDEADADESNHPAGAGQESGVDPSRPRDGLLTPASVGPATEFERAAVSAVDAESRDVGRDLSLIRTELAQLRRDIQDLSLRLGERIGKKLEKIGLEIGRLRTTFAAAVEVLSVPLLRPVAGPVVTTRSATLELAERLNLRVSPQKRRSYVRPAVEKLKQLIAPLWLGVVIVTASLSLEPINRQAGFEVITIPGIEKDIPVALVFALVLGLITYSVPGFLLWIFGLWVRSTRVFVPMLLGTLFVYIWLVVQTDVSIDGRDLLSSILQDFRQLI
jgi:serine/threonine protein kinase